MAVSWNLSQPTGTETTYDITTSTDVRDVSEILDAVYLADTPFTNRLKWGAPCHNTKIEWVSDNIGRGYIILNGAVASDASVLVVGSSGLGDVSLAVRQLHTGTVMKYEGSSRSNEYEGYLIINNIICLTNGSVGFEYLCGCSVSTEVADLATLFIIGNAVKESSLPRVDTTRPRVLHSNRTQIFRQDVRMSGTRTQLEMHAVPNELRHQIGLRAKEYKRELERSAILNQYDPAGSTEARLFGGIYYYLRQQSGSHIDATTTSLGETELNNALAALWEFGATPNVLLMGPTQARNIPKWERSRVRVEQDSHVAGFYVNHYMSDLGIDLEILVNRWVPTRYAFILDVPKIQLIPYKGRKYNLTKLGLKGDFVEYQLISEVTLKIEGTNNGQHGMFTALT